MSNISLNLLNKLPADQISIIRQVVHAATSEGLSLFIVGAQARDLLLQYVYDLPVQLVTNDIDLESSTKAGISTLDSETS